MSPRTGRPKTDNPKGVQVSARMDAETIEKLEYCMKALDLTKAEVLRRGVEEVFQSIKKVSEIRG